MKERGMLVSPASLQRHQIGTYHCSFETLTAPRIMLDILSGKV